MSNTLYTAATLWNGPDDIEKVVYIAGITQKVFTNLKLVNSYDTDYPDNTAFKIVGTSSNDKNRIYKPRSTDNIILSNIKNNTSYGIDDDKNLLIFPSTYPLNDQEASEVTVKLIVNYASIFKANLVSFESVIDFSYLNEKAITSMLAVDNGIFLAGVSGRIWFFDGNIITGPIYSLYDGQDLPATCMIKHRFAHEEEDYIYVASDKKPRLYRSKISTAANGSDWEEVYGSGALAASTGGVLSMVSAFNKIFLGCRNNIILKYSRTNQKVLSQPVDLVTEEVVVTDTAIETLTQSTLINNNIDDFEAVAFDVKCLEVGRNQIFAGLSNKPEIWSYAEITQDNPESFELWSNVIFDEVFRNDPAPAQYYSYNSLTNSRSDNNLAIGHYYDSKSPAYNLEALIIKGNTRSSTGASASGSRFFEFSDGSDWEQALTKILPDQEFFNVQCASSEEITSLSNVTIIDGYVLKDYDVVLLKDQPRSSSINNGIYRFQSGYLIPFKSVSVENTTSILGFYVENGYINATSRFLLSSNSYNDSTYEFYYPKYTLEFNARNLAYSDTISCNPLEGCSYLNQLLDNDEKIGSATTYVGYQGIEVADIYNTFKLNVNNNKIILSSGNNSVTKSLPTIGVYKNWNFSSSLGSTTDGWIANDFVTSMIGSTISSVDIAGNNFTKYTLRVEPSNSGNPKITFNNLNVDVDPEAILKLRVNITPANNFGFINSFIKLYWSYNGADYTNYSSTPIQTSEDYVDYVIKPTWKGNISNIQIEFENLPELTARPDYIYIDYIKIVNENNYFDMNNYFSTVRVGVEGRDIKVWLGKQEYPYIYEKNFLSLDNYSPKYINSLDTSTHYNKPSIKIGKIENSTDDSLFGYNRLSFYVGEVYEPVTKKIFDFHQHQKLQKSGGVRLFTYHDGTIYSIADGFDSNKVNENPDDRQCKLFKYDSTHQTWINEDITFDRKQTFNSDGTYNLYGIVRPIASISYKGILYLSGQYGNIKVI